MGPLYLRPIVAFIGQSTSWENPPGALFSEKKNFPQPLAKMAVAAAGDAFPPNANKGLGGRATTKDTAFRPTIHAGSTPVAKDGRALEHQQQTVRLLAEARKN